LGSSVTYGVMRGATFGSTWQFSTERPTSQSGRRLRSWPSARKL